MSTEEIPKFYCEKYCNGNIELLDRDEKCQYCKTQCFDCMAAVGERQAKTKELLK